MLGAMSSWQHNTYGGRQRAKVRGIDSILFEPTGHKTKSSTEANSNDGKVPLVLLAGHLGNTTWYLYAVLYSSSLSIYVAKSYHIFDDKNLNCTCITTILNLRLLVLHVGLVCIIRIKGDPIHILHNVNLFLKSTLQIKVSNTWYCSQCTLDNMHMPLKHSQTKLSEAWLETSIYRIWPKSDNIRNKYRILYGKWKGLKSI